MSSITDAVLCMEYIKFLLIVAAFLAEYTCCTLHHLGVDTVFKDYKPMYVIGTKSVMEYCWIEIYIQITQVQACYLVSEIIYRL